MFTLGKGVMVVKGTFIVQLCYIIENLKVSKYFLPPVLKSPEYFGLNTKLHSCVMDNINWQPKTKYFFIALKRFRGLVYLLHLNNI